MCLWRRVGGLYVRWGVWRKLEEARAFLPEGIRFCIVEGWRSLEDQEKLFKEALESLGGTKWIGKEQLFRAATKRVSPVLNFDGSKNTPPHSTGGAIDVFLQDSRTKKLVDMGIFPTELERDVDGVLSETCSQKISASARSNRRVMVSALKSVGFVNYPTEYWHWSYGDKYWALKSKEAVAFYGSVTSPGGL